MVVWTHDRWRFPLPDGHRFPIDKYSLLRERAEAAGVEVREAEPVPWAWLEAVHDPALLDRIRTGTLSVREQRGLGIPWSPELVERGRRSVGGTVAAARSALENGLGMNLGGGTHHAGRAFARGYCLFNDVAVALARMRAEGGARRALVVDCDVHQGDGTADLLAGDPDCFTLSLHGARNYPFQRIASDLDVDLPSGTGDEGYLRGAGAGARPRDPARAAPSSRSISPAPTRGTATASAGWRSPRTACAGATSSCSTGCGTRAPRCASCWPAATRRTCATPSTSTPRPSPRWRGASNRGRRPRVNPGVDDLEEGPAATDRPARPVAHAAQHRRRRPITPGAAAPAFGRRGGRPLKCQAAAGA